MNIKNSPIFDTDNETINKAYPHYIYIRHDYKDRLLDALKNLHDGQLYIKDIADGYLNVFECKLKKEDIVFLKLIFHDIFIKKSPKIKDWQNARFKDS